MKITGAVVALLLAGCAGGTGLGGGANFYSKTGGTDAQRLADYFACRRQMQTEISVSPWLWSPALR